MLAWHNNIWSVWIEVQWSCLKASRRISAKARSTQWMLALLYDSIGCLSNYKRSNILKFREKATENSNCVTAVLYSLINMCLPSSACFMIKQSLSNRVLSTLWDLKFIMAFILIEMTDFAWMLLVVLSEGVDFTKIDKVYCHQWLFQNYQRIAWLMRVAWALSLLCACCSRALAMRNR